MTLGVARAATAPELVLYRTPGQWSKLYAAIFAPSTIYTARINQTFATLDGVLELTYDTGSGTLGNVLEDMTLLVGSTAGAWDKGICRVRAMDATKVYIGQTSDIRFANNDYLTVIDDFGLWARHILMDGETPYMDGGVAYADQHKNFDPVPIMGGNRVLKLTGATIATQFNWSQSYVLDSTISGYVCTAPTASATAGLTTSTPTITFNTCGWHLVHLTVTAANGKSFRGTRYVYVWNEANPPAEAEISGDCSQDIDSGGWQFELTLISGADITTVRDHALVILFSEDHYGTTVQSIGSVAGCENILVQGWIAKESIDWNPEAGQVKFTGYTAQYWLALIPSFPDGVEFVRHVPTAWTDMQHLTINKALWHFLHWRTTATRIMDIFLTDNNLYTSEAYSLASTLWEQIREIAYLQVLATCCINAQNQLFINPHPQLVPVADRSWPTVMAITTQDWEEEISFERVTMNQTSVVSLSGMTVDANESAHTYFSLAPGHTHTRYGNIEMLDKLLVTSQAHANILCGLVWMWKNNPYPDIPVTFSANNRLIDCAMRSKCTISIVAGDTKRGITYSGGLIPKSVSYVHDPETGYLQTQVIFEAEVLEGMAVNGDVPGSGDLSTIPDVSFPPLPDIPILIPGVPSSTPAGPRGVLLHDVNMGLIYSDDFNAIGPHWYTVNNGLTATQYQNLNTFFVTPSGALYAAWVKAVDDTNYTAYPIFIARADKVGGTFVIIQDELSLRPAVFAGQQWGVFGMALNPLKPDTVGAVWGQVNVNKKFHLGTGGVFVPGVDADLASYFLGGLSYGLGEWLYTRYDLFGIISADGTTVTRSGSVGSMEGMENMDGYHISAGSTGITFHGIAGAPDLIKGAGNLLSSAVLTSLGTPKIGFACDPSGTLMMTRYDVGLRGKSTDGGATWSTMGSLPFGNWWWSYAGAGVAASPSVSRWVAAGGTTIRYSDDGGATWINKEGYIQDLVPIPNINGVKVIVP